MAAYRPTDLDTWEDFLEALAELRAEQQTLREATVGGRIPDLLFRGQREVSWDLTTIERYRPASLSLMHYFSSIWAAKTQIEAHTQQRWDLPLGL